MKTFEQHLQEEYRTIDNLYSILTTLRNEEIEESVKVYATEAIKADREMYKECLELFIPQDKWDEANAFLSSYGNGLAKELQKKER